MKKVARVENFDSAFLGRAEQYAYLSLLIGLISIVLLVVSFFMSFGIQLSMSVVALIGLVGAGNMYYRAVFLRKLYGARKQTLQEPDVSDEK